MLCCKSKHNTTPCASRDCCRSRSTTHPPPPRTQTPHPPNIPEVELKSEINSRSSVRSPRLHVVQVESKELSPQPPSLLHTHTHTYTSRERRGTGKGPGERTHQPFVEDEARADACRQPGADDQQERNRSILVVFVGGAHPCCASEELDTPCSLRFFRLCSPASFTSPPFSPLQVGTTGYRRHLSAAGLRFLMV